MKTKYLFLVYTNTLSSYILAESFDEAKNTFEKYLSKHEYDWTKNRIVIKIELIAATDVYPANDIFKQIIIGESIIEDINKNDNDNANKWWVNKNNEGGDSNVNEIRSNEIIK